MDLLLASGLEALLANGGIHQTLILHSGPTILLLVMQAALRRGRLA